MQAPDFSQNFNRYSYALNNPLRFTDPSGKFFWLAGLIGFVSDYIISGISTHDWGWKSIVNGLKGGLLAAAGAEFGSAVSVAAKSAGIGAGLSSVIGGTFGGAFSGGLGASWSGTNFGQGILTGAAGGLLGSAVGLGSHSLKFWGRAAVTTLGGGISGGAVAGLSGGNFWEGVRNGAIGATAGFITSEVGSYLVMKAETTQILMDKLGLSADDVKRLKSYGLGRINLKTLQNVTPEEWKMLQASKKDYSAISKFLSTRDLKPVEGIIKSGQMHIRYGTQAMQHKGAYGETNGVIQPNEVNIHFDHFDAVLFPLTHILFDSVFQSVFYHVK